LGIAAEAVWAFRWAGAGDSDTPLVEVLLSEDVPWRWVRTLGQSIARRSLGLVGSIQCRRVELKIPQYTLHPKPSIHPNPQAASGGRRSY
jgi:hypothetical protein